jgi:microcin C transport system substrate-binding protein
MPGNLRRLPALACAVLLGLATLSPFPASAQAEAPTITTSTLAEYGAPLYPADMDHWPYANPDAPKGGTVKLWGYGTFDTLNALILRGEAPRNLGMIDVGLMTGSGDELASMYPMIATSVTYAADVSWAIFTLRPEARYSDGQPITADDFVFSFEAIRDYGTPFIRIFFEDVASAEALDAQHVKFTFRSTGRMKPLIVAAGLTPLSRTWWDGSPGRDISQPTMTPFPSSGPYRFGAVEAGRSIIFERVQDWWGADLPTARGQYNFDRVRFDYYQDRDVAFEAFHGGAYDFLQVYSSRQWATGFDTPTVKDGSIVKTSFPDESPKGLQGFYLNTRRPPLDDVRVRTALGLLFDFEWTNQNLMYGLYTRSKSFFPNTDYAAPTLPDAAELALLEPYRAQLPPELFTEPVPVSSTDGTGTVRAQQRQALVLLREAGWALKGGKLLGPDGQQMHLQVVESSGALARIIEPWLQNLRRVGIDAEIRVIGDAANYQRLLDSFAFDITVVNATFYPPPGAELVSRFASKDAAIDGSGNFAGIQSPVVDALLQELLAAQGDLPRLKIVCHALDRVLMWGRYVIPNWYNANHLIAYWDHMDHPATLPKYGVGSVGGWDGVGVGFPELWWSKP